MTSRPNTWFRFYIEAIDDPKVQKLSPDIFKTWVNLLCLASAGDGVLPGIDDMAFRLRLTEKVATDHVSKLRAQGLLDEMPSGLCPHNWAARQFVSDVSTERVRKFREKQAATLKAVS